MCLIIRMLINRILIISKRLFGLRFFVKRVCHFLQLTVLVARLFSVTISIFNQLLYCIIDC